MDRPLPTDPPDEPVNRIKQFFGEGSAKPFLMLPKSAPIETKAALSGHPPEAIQMMLETVPKNLVEEFLLELAVRYGKNPDHSETVLIIALAYQRLEEWDNSLAYFEWYKKLAPAEFVAFIDSTIAQLRERLKKQKTDDV